MKEVRRKEQKEAHLYMMAKVITNDTFRNYGGTDLGMMDADPGSDPSAPLSYRILRTMTVGEFLEFLASEIGKNAKSLRLWVMVNRLNKTIRPDQPVMDLSPTLEEVYSKSAASRDTCLRLWVEEATEVDEAGNGIWQSYTGQPNGAPVKNDNILLLLKHFDTEAQTLRGVGHAYVGKDKKVEELVPIIAQRMGWGDKLEGEDKLLLWEVSSNLCIGMGTATEASRKSNRP